VSESKPAGSGPGKMVPRRDKLGRMAPGPHVFVPDDPAAVSRAGRLSDSINRLAAAIECLTDRLEQDAELEVPFVLRPAPPKGSRLRG
jgi:hypothetical protein